jgi:hypothetical protein
MAAEQLQIQVQANVQQAINGLNAFNAQLQATGKASESLGATSLQILNNQLLRLQRIASNPNLSPEQYQRLATLINKTAKEADTLTRSINTLNRANGQFAVGANQANTAMINLSRTVSDAPFGFIGIANNIGPLIENFVALRRESGGTGNALKQLGASLAGPGGLIVGVQLVVAAIQFAQLGFSRWAASSKKAKEDTDKLKQANEGLIESVTKQRLEFESLVKVAKDVTQTDLARNQALERLNQILPDTIGKLNQQNIATEQGAAIIRSYIAAVEAKATAELLSGRIAANNVQIFDIQQRSLQEIADLNKEIEQNTKLRKSLEGSGRLEQEARTQQKISNAQKDIVNIQKDTQIEINKINTLNENLRNEYLKQVPIVNTLNESKTKTGKITNDITDLLKKYREELKGIDWDEQNRQIDGTNERVKLAGDTLKNLYLAGVKQTSAAWQEVNNQLSQFQKAQNYRNFRKGLEEINNAVREQAKTFTFSEKTFQDANTKSLEVAQKNIKIILGNYQLWELGNKNLIKQQQELAKTITEAVTPAIDNVINAFAQGQDPFEALTQSVRQLIAELAKAVIKSLILKAITSAIAPGAGALGGVSSSQFIIRGDILRNITLGR